MHAAKGDQHHAAGDQQLPKARGLFLRSLDLDPRFALGRGSGGSLRGAPRCGDKIRFFVCFGDDARLGKAGRGFGGGDAVGGRRDGARTGRGTRLQRMVGRQVGVDRLSGRAGAARCRLRG